MSVSASILISVTPVTKGTPANIFWESCLEFDFCYDLELYSQGQAVTAFLSEWGFPNFVKSTRGIFIKRVRNFSS